ncbi:MAG: GGDEF domain-containing protein [Syntrophotaleaceae bacterium]
MNKQPGAKKSFMSLYLLHSLLMAVLLLALAIPLYLIFTKPVTESIRGIGFLLMGLLPIAIAAVLYHMYGLFIRPVRQLLQNILTFGRGKTPPRDYRIPALWTPWFESLENSFQSLSQKTEEIVLQNQNLERLLRERTAELELINSTLGEEMEVRSITENALQAVNMKLQETSTVDGLTGIANRRKFEEYLSQTWGQQVRDRAPLSLILCEIDRFSQLQDTYGYQASDYCLRELAGVVKNVLHRPGDLPARCEGGKFYILLPKTDSQGAIQVAEKLQQAIADQQNQAASITSRIGFTIGLASILPDRGSSAKKLMEMAEQALHRARAQEQRCVAI